MRLTRISKFGLSLLAAAALAACSSTLQPAGKASTASKTTAAPSVIARTSSSPTLAGVRCQLADESTVLAAAGSSYTEVTSLSATDCGFVSSPDYVIRLHSNAQSTDEFNASMRDMQSTDPYSIAGLVSPLYFGAKLQPIDVHSTSLLSDAKAGYEMTVTVSGIHAGMVIVNDGRTTVAVDYHPYDQAKAYKLLALVLDNLKASYNKK